MFLLACEASAARTVALAQNPSLTELEITDKLRIALQRMPYYGPFDLIGFSVKGGAVTLNGWVYQAFNKDDAEESAKKVPGVTQAVNNIQVLPVSISDDQIRRAVLRKIDSDDFLQKYGTPILGINGSRWGRHFWGRGVGPRGFGSFPGTEPIGNYAIHIIVKGGQVALYGAVNAEVDKVKAGTDARGVFGVLGVDNQLDVVKD
ncbi:MAG: BON domain-containing protein [Acidobacteriota bacterium]